MNSSRIFPVQCKECGSYATSLHLSAVIISAICGTVVGIPAAFALFLYGLWAGVAVIWVYGIIFMPIHLIGRAQPVAVAIFGPTKFWKTVIFHSLALTFIFFLWRTSNVVFYGTDK